MIKAGIAGGSGYVAGELLRCLVHHPEVEIDFIFSHSKSGKKVSEIHQDLFSHDELVLTDQINPEVDVLFLCLGHGYSKKFLTQHHFSGSTKIIDLSADFRLQSDSKWGENEFIYGLIELNKERIKKATHIANPGCFATAIQLALLPLANAKKINEDIHVHALTGSTGAGNSLTDTSHFSWRNNNISIYKAFTHQHLEEITETVSSLDKEFNKSINFLPLRGDFTRGIFASLYINSDLSIEDVLSLYQSYYEDTVFTKISTDTIHLKQVVNTNYCLLQVQVIEGKVLITSVIDNLLKGAAGQAIQNMNLMFGLDETTGLNFKANYF